MQNMKPLNEGLANLFPAMACSALISALIAVVMGGIVRVTGSGLGCPDWPLCHGGIIPPLELSPWLEYMHRLSASVSGIFTLLTVWTALKRYGVRSKAFHLVLTAAALLVTQAILGAYTVLSELSPGIALIHTAVGTTLVATFTVIVAGSIRVPWLNYAIPESQDMYRFRRLMLALSVTTFILILSGAYVTRSEGAPLACTSVPFCGISVLDMVGIQWIHMAHRAMGLVVAIMMLVVLTRAIAIGHPGINQMISLLTGLLGVQIILGIGNVVLHLPAELRALHLAVAILFFTAVVFLASSLRDGIMQNVKIDTTKGLSSSGAT